MLPLLTQYLLQYKKVGIPHVGTILLVQHPAQADVIGRQILPPTFSAELKPAEDISDHQLRFLDGFLNSGRDAVSDELKFFGGRLREKINGPGLEWNGLGTINGSTQTLAPVSAALKPVAAEKVLRAGARHTILVGDQEITAVEMAGRRESVNMPPKKRAVAVAVGWLLLIVSVLAIALFLYTGKFRVNAAGSKRHPVSYKPPSFRSDPIS